MQAVLLSTLLIVVLNTTGISKCQPLHQHHCSNAFFINSCKNTLLNIADANRKVKAGTPFTRPDFTHPKLVGAAGIVPNNMTKHKRKPVKYGCIPFWN